MAILTNCPRCQTSIQVSEERSDPHERFRCPKCRDIFLLHEALDILAESPPEALPVALEGGPQPVAGSPAGATAAAGAVPPLLPALAPAAAKDSDTDEYLDQSDADDHYEDHVSDSRPVRRPAPQGSMIGQMTGVVLGGVAGIYVGAMVLNYLNIPLPEAVRGLPGLSKPGAAAPANPPIAEKADPVPAPKIEPVTPPPEPKTVAPPDTKVVVDPPKKTEIPPEKKTPPPPEHAIKGAPTYTPDQLGAALGEANKASGGGIGKSNVVGSIDPASYEKLCELAERVTFVVATAGDTTLDNRRRGSGDVLKRLAGSQDNLVKLGQHALQKFAGVPTPPGIVLAGVIQSVEQRGKLWAIDVMLYGGAKRVIVVSPVLNNMKPGDKRVILGVVVDDPAANLAGFSGAEKRVIWGSLPVEIPASTFK